MSQINMSLLAKLVDDLLVEDLRSEALVAFPWIVDQRLVVLDDDASGIGQGYQKLGRLFSCSHFGGLRPSVLDDSVRRDVPISVHGSAAQSPRFAEQWSLRPVELCPHLLSTFEFQDPLAHQPLEPGILAPQACFAFRSFENLKPLWNVG